MYSPRIAATEIFNPAEHFSNTVIIDIVHLTELNHHERKSLLEKPLSMRINQKLNYNQKTFKYEI